MLPATSFFLGPAAQLIVLSGLAAGLFGGGVYLLWGHRRNPEERERRRRQRVNLRGRIGGAEILECDGDVFYYQYTVSGVTYEASQDLSALSPLLPENRMRALGSGWVKFLPENPANSVILCEAWSGLPHKPAPQAIAQRSAS